MLVTAKSSYRPMFVVLLVCLAAALAWGSDFWAKKPYQHWSKEEAGRILEDSPWSTTVTLSGVNPSPLGGAHNTTAYGSEQETNPTLSYSLKFRSAEPVRQAEVRLSQLSSHYDTMSAEHKAAFDANAEKFLAVKFSDRVVVSVTFRTDIQAYDSLLRTYWGRQSVATLGPTVFLNAGKEKLSLMDYHASNDTFQFTFPRPKQVSADDKISVEFIHPTINVIGQQRIFQEFSLKKMVVNGEPLF